uniref:Uncharacterized protein n=1 Tax=Anguilla anguilla TaxID=7936 RepID=A0A0E9T014_ANGAN
MRSETHKMKSSVGPLLLLSLVAFASVTLARSVFVKAAGSVLRPLCQC